MKNRASLIVIILLLLVVVGGGLTTWYVVRHQVLQEVHSDASKTLTSDTTTPYTDLAGKPFSFATYRGTVRVVNAWATWSPYAKTELPVLDQVANDFVGKPVTMIAVDRKEQSARVQAYLKTLGTLSHIHFVVDTTDAFYRSVGGYAMPETVIYDKRGNIVSHIRGIIDATKLKALIATALSK